MIINDAFKKKHDLVFRQGIPPVNAHLKTFIICTLGENIAEYNRHLKQFKLGKRKYPVHFRLSLVRLNRFLESHLTGEVNQVWQEVVQHTNRTQGKTTTSAQALAKKHAPRIACLSFLLTCLTNNDGPDPDKQPTKKPLPPAVSDFNEFLIRGISELQTQGEAQEGFRLVQARTGKREAAIRDFFRTFCAGRYEVVESESPKGKGRIDLKVYDAASKTWLVVEFKGVWNYKHRSKLANQTTGYLTDVDDYAFTVTINHLKKDITQQHRQQIAQKKTGYIYKSWEIIPYRDKNYSYYSSEHRLNGRVVKLFHFILSIPQKKY